MTKPFMILVTSLAFAGGPLYADLCSCLGSISSKVSVAESIIDIIESKIDHVSGGSPCNPMGLSQSDFSLASPPTVTLPINADPNGTTYCATQNLTGNITISGSDITLDLNGHELVGQIIVDPGATRAIIKNGAVLSPAPTDPTNATDGIIFIQASGTQVTDCFIVCTAAAGTDANGINGINITGNGSIVDSCSIERCFIQAGFSGISSGTTPTASGGIGVYLDSTATNPQIIDSQIYGGGGQTGSTTQASNNGGAGIVNNANGLIIARCIVVGGTAADIISSPFNINFTGTLGSGGDGLDINANDCLITQSTLYGGAGSGPQAPVITEATSLTSGNGGHAVNATGGTNLTITSSMLTGGTSGTFAGNAIALDSGPTHGSFVIGSGGAGCNLVSCLSPTVVECAISGGNSGSAQATGTIGTTALNSIQAGGNGMYINGSTNAFVGHCSIAAGASGNATTIGGAIANVQICPTSFTTCPTTGFGIFDNSQETVIEYCQITTPNGGSINSGISAVFRSSAGSDGGTGVSINGQFTVLSNSSIATGNGGNNNTDLGTGGNGGLGILIQNTADGAQIRNNSIGQTGSGGSTADIVQTNSNGGTGIIAVSGAGTNFLIELSNNKINNTGIAGTGGVGGSGGQAILDGTASGTTIYGNFANAIAGTPAYVFSAASAVDVPNGTPFSTLTPTSGTPFQNVHNP